MTLILILFITACSVVQNATAGRVELIAGITRLNADVLELRNEIERSISHRCDSIRGCYRSSYDECQSEYTSDQHCPSSKENLGYVISECGAGEKCNGLFDDTITTVRLPANLAKGKDGNPTNPEVVEAICYTRTAQRWMVNKYNEDKKLWKDELKTNSPQMYFGSSTGVFRIFPARHSRECGRYDPRTRPWYQASLPSTISNSVKPRRVVILMDTSRSMDEEMNTVTGETKMRYMKRAVTAAVSSLTEEASIAVIRFGEVPQIVGRPGSSEPFLWQKASAKHKEMIINDVNDMEVNGRSNWVAGFNSAFVLIANSLRHIKARNKHLCKLENIAFLFFSDGEYNMPSGVEDEDIVDLVSSHVEKIESSGDFHMHTFLYSLGNTNVDQVAKQISCAVDGYWAPVTSNIAPANVTTGYQSLFSTPMGTQAFYNYTSWSEPYIFATSEELGYTVSSLVYNRDVEPPRYMGAVGMDISAEAAKQLYGSETIDEAVEAMNEIIGFTKLTNFNTTCEQQRINLTYCETQSMRQLSGGNEAICLPKIVNVTAQALDYLLPNEDIIGDVELNITDSNATTTVSSDQIFNQTVKPPTEEEVTDVIFDDLLNCSKGFITQCAGYDEYPDNLWRNVNLQGKEFHDRVCCEVGSNTVSDQCPKLDEIRDTKMSDSQIFGVMFASLAVAELIGCYFCFYYKKRRNGSSND